MSRIIITHVGTSVLQCAAFARAQQLERLKQDLTQKGKERTADLDTYVASLQTGLANTWKTTTDGWRRRQDSPAEIASLNLLGVQDSTVVLLHSDTPAGRFCARLLEKVLQQDIGREAGYPACIPATGCTVRTVQINDMHVNEQYQRSSWWEGFRHGHADRRTQQTEQDVFVRKGLVNYIRTIVGFYRELLPTGGELLFNVTAGYKGMIPVARDLTLLLEAHYREWRTRQANRAEAFAPLGTFESAICYVFERSNDLIRYSALPVSFDFSAFSVDLLRAASADAGLERNAPDPRCFFEPLSNGRWRRSALGEVVLTCYEELYEASAATRPTPERYQG